MQSKQLLNPNILTYVASFHYKMLLAGSDVGEPYKHTSGSRGELNYQFPLRLP